MTLSAGSLDRRITVQHATTTTNDYNEDILSWHDLAKVMAARRDVSDMEKFTSGQTGSALVSRFVIRYSGLTKTITPVDRILHDDVVWNIKGIKEVSEGRKRFLEITAVRDLDVG